VAHPIRIVGEGGWGLVPDLTSYTLQSMHSRAVCAQACTQVCIYTRTQHYLYYPDAWVLPRRTPTSRTFLRRSARTRSFIQRAPLLLQCCATRRPLCAWRAADLISVRKCSPCTLLHTEVLIHWRFIQQHLSAGAVA